jgi:hypothetical protein
VVDAQEFGQSWSKARARFHMKKSAANLRLLNGNKEVLDII